MNADTPDRKHARAASTAARSRVNHSARRRIAHTVRGLDVEPLEGRSLMAVLGVQSLDGTSNNLVNPEWGSTGEMLLRRTAPAYADGVSAPAGADRPSARLVSNLLSQNPEGGIINARDWTAFVYAWGQFLDHDIGLTETATPRERFSIPVPSGDAWFDPAGTGTMTISMSRSAWDPSTGVGTSSPRQQVNSITAFIDGSQIYGVDATRAAAVREFTGGRLRTSAGNLLPFNTAGLPNANDAHRVADSQLFLAGDVRANENPELLALHTLFVREHNRIAASAAAANPSWTDEQLFQHARRIVIAELQKITFEEFLPSLLGGPKPAAPVSGVDAIAPYRGYRADVNPGIANEFSTAAFRVGHSMLGDDIQFLDNSGREIRPAMALRDAFFDPRPLSEVGIDGIVKYLASDRAQEIDLKVVDDVRNFLFGAPGQGGFDLAALNIQRGRDHGLADYNSVRVAYGLPRLTSFAEITPDKSVQTALQQAYGSIDTIDLWVGGLAERHLPGSSVGATFTRIIIDQFTRLRDGDRYWYENALSPAAIQMVKTTSLADVVRRNTNVTNLQPDVFVFRASIAGTVFGDGNGDGLRQPVEAGLAGATVLLVDASGTTVATTKADASGRYAFTRLSLGSFRVVVALPEGGTAATSRTVTITRGGQLPPVDVGVTPRPTRPIPPPPAPPRPPVATPTPRPSPSPLPPPQQAPSPTVRAGLPRN